MNWYQISGLSAFTREPLTVQTVASNEEEARKAVAWWFDEITKIEELLTVKEMDDQERENKNEETEHKNQICRF